MENARMIRRYYKYIKPYTSRYIMLLFFSLFLSISTLPIPILVSKIIDNGVLNQKMDTIAGAGILILVIYAFKSFFQYFVNKKFSIIGNEVCVAIRTDIIKHVQKLPIKYVEQDGIGKLISLIMNDVSIASNLITTNMISDLINNCFVMIFIIVALFLINWKLTLGLLIIVPFYYIISRKFNSRVRSISRTTQNQSANVISLLTDILANEKIIRAYNSENIFENKFNGNLKKLAGLHNSANGINFIIQQLTYFFINVSPLVVIWFGIYLVLNGEMSIGILIAFYQYVMQVFAPFNVFMNFNVQYQTAYGALSRLDDLLNTSREFNFEEPICCDRMSGNISFKNVSFSYSEKKALSNISFEIHSGEFVAIVGPSGSGKTTITNLLLRFYEPDSGKLFYDGNCSRRYDKKFLRSQIGIVTQEPYLFNSTIRENILLSKPDANDNEMIEAAKLARIHDHVISLENGYDSIISERGNNLSGGQKQRISLARVFLQKPPIVIFDEATSALDSRLESMINETLFQLSGKSTCIVVSHRIAAISGADKILVVKDGKIVECGKHEELLKKENVYHELYYKQINGEQA